MLDKELRSQLESKMEDLIAGRVSPSGASHWAQDLFRKEGARKIIENSTSLFSLSKKSKKARPWNGQNIT